MITAVSIANFKCFRHLRLMYGKLTLLTGFNGGGKSSAVQPMLLLAQTLRRDIAARRFPLNGADVRLGSVGDVVPTDSASSRLTIEVESSFGNAAWHFTGRAGDRHLHAELPLARPKVTADSFLGEVESLEDASSNIADLLTRLSFVSASRVGVSDTFGAPDDECFVANWVGADGRFAPYCYHLLADEPVPEARRHPAEAASSLRKQVDAWLGALFPGGQANVQDMPHVNAFSLQFRRSDIGPWLRPANVGYGYTYAFPIILALLGADDGDVVVIDSPEAHLHPSGQSAMGRMIAYFAAAGVQVIVETHSDHLLNGTRLAVRDGVLAEDDVKVHFFNDPALLGHGVTSLHMDREGNVSEWPAGFFDQGESDLARLAGWE